MEEVSTQLSRETQLNRKGLPHMMIDAVIIEEFKRLTSETLTHEGQRGVLAGIVDELAGILEQAAELRIDPEADILEGETALRDGLAISPTQAAMCAGDFQRTATFLRGLHDAIKDAVEAKSSTPVRVLYAGSGPYATLAVPLMTVFPPEAVRFTLLDMHPVSIESAKAVVHRLGLEESVEAYVLADACDYTIPAGATPDVIVSETMSTALEKEPQVAIMRHLLGQAPNAIMVPESIEVDAFLVDTSHEPDRIIPESVGRPSSGQPDRISVGPVFELNASAIHSWTSLSGERLPAATLSVPPPPDPSYRLYLFTSITTYGPHVLRTHESGLTAIREVMNIDSISEGGAVSFHYRLGADPCLVAESPD